MNLNYVEKLEKHKKLLSDVYNDFTDNRYVYYIYNNYNEFWDYVNNVFYKKKVFVKCRNAYGVIRRIADHDKRITFIVYLDSGGALALSVYDLEFINE